MANDTAAPELPLEFDNSVSAGRLESWLKLGKSAELTYMTFDPNRFYFTCMIESLYKDVTLHFRFSDIWPANAQTLRLRPTHDTKQFRSAMFNYIQREMRELEVLHLDGGNLAHGWMDMSYECFQLIKRASPKLKTICTQYYDFERADDGVCVVTSRTSGAKAKIPLRGIALVPLHCSEADWKINKLQKTSMPILFDLIQALGVRKMSMGIPVANGFFTTLAPLLSQNTSLKEMYLIITANVSVNLWSNVLLPALEQSSIQKLEGALSFVNGYLHSSRFASFSTFHTFEKPLQIPYELDTSLEAERSAILSLIDKYHFPSITKHPWTRGKIAVPLFNASHVPIHMSEAIMGADLAAFTNFGQVVSIQFPQLSPEWIPHLHKLTSLRSLKFASMPNMDFFLTVIQQLSSIQSLAVPTCWLMSPTLCETIQNHPNLLNLIINTVDTDPLIQCLPDRLQVLEIGNFNAAGEVDMLIEHLPRLTNLTRLYVQGHFGYRIMPYLGCLPHLVRFSTEFEHRRMGTPFYANAPEETKRFSDFIHSNPPLRHIGGMWPEEFAEAIRDALRKTNTNVCTFETYKNEQLYTNNRVRAYTLEMWCLPDPRWTRFSKGEDVSTKLTLQVNYEKVSGYPRSKTNQSPNAVQR